MLTLCIQATSFMYIDSTYLQKAQEKGWLEYVEMTRFLRLFNVLVGLYLSKPRFESQLNSYRLIDVVM